MRVCFQSVTFFFMKNPESRTKIMKIGSDNGTVITALHERLLKFATLEF